MAGTAARRRAYGLEPGDRVGPYVCVTPLAMGGMAELYVAHPEGQPRADAYVVIKRALPHLAVDAEFTAMFLKEARLASALDHPNITRVLDAGEDEGDFYMALEYVHGYDLRALVRAAAKRGGALPLDVAMGVAVQLCAGLHHAHEQVGRQGKPLQLVHRDVTPSNVLLDLSGRVLLTDFGIARALTTMRTTRAGVIKGKLGYMSPEQCRDGHLDRRSDLFSVGVLLYEMTTGYRMFKAGNDFAVLNKITKGEFVAPSEVVPDYPEALETIVRRCVAVAPEDRYESAEALGRALENFAVAHGLDLAPPRRAAYLDEMLGPKVLPDVPPEVGPPTARTGETAAVSVTPGRTRRRGAWVVAAAMVVGGVAGAAVVMASTDRPPLDRPASTAPSDVDAPGPDAAPVAGGPAPAMAPSLPPPSAASVGAGAAATQVVADEDAGASAEASPDAQGSADDPGTSASTPATEDVEVEAPPRETPKTVRDKAGRKAGRKAKPAKGAGRETPAGPAAPAGESILPPSMRNKSQTQDGD